MSNMGFLSLGLLDVEGREAADPKARVDVIGRDGVVIHQFSDLRFPSGNRLQITAYPQASSLRGEVFTTRYRPCRIDFFTLKDDEERLHQVRVVRDPNQWRAQFVLWNELPGNFEPLKAVLNASTIDVIEGESLGRFVEDRYDRVEAPRTILAKAALLNLFAKLTTIPEPIGQRNPWFNFIDRILLIDRERLVAIVDPEMGEIVRRIRENRKSFPRYKRADSSLHFKKLKERLPGYEIVRSEILSVKTDEQYANLQLTLVPARDPQGQAVLLLDVDIDEHGVLLNHLIDVLLVHPVTGGTHPYDIHESLFLLAQNQNLRLGYELV